MQGLASPVTVDRDSLGIPTISAASRIDAARALGFVHAQDRFFQMDLQRRQPAGELSALVGAALGLVAAQWGSKLLEHMLYGVNRSDVASFVIGALVLVTTALLACIVPMRRAVAVDPLVAIRAD